MKAFPILLISFVMVTGGAAGAQTHLELRAWETSPDSPVPCRVHLNNERGEPVITEAFPAWHDHFVFPGRATSPLAPGRYDDEVERGPEYRRLRGSICLSKHQTVPLDLRLERIVDLKTEGWRSGDLHIHRNPESVPLLARAEDLHFAPVITWWNGKNTWSARDLPNPRWVRFADQGFSDLLAGEDEREGGALLYIHLPRPLPIQNAGREFPSPMRFLEEAHRSFPEGHADIEKPFWWDVPVWLAGGMADTIGLANNHMCRGRGWRMNTVPLERWRRAGSLGLLSFEESGWFLVRVGADREDTFRFASTAPWYVQAKDGPRRVSRGSARFFLDWIDERMSRIRLENADEQKAVLGYQREAREFWEKQLALANAP